MPIDPLTGAAIGSALAALGIELFGPKGDYERVSGPSERDIRRSTEAYRGRGRRAAYEGARATAQAAGGAIARRGGGRSGAIPVAAGGVGRALGQNLADVESGAADYETRLRQAQQYEYMPSGWERAGALIGQGAGILGSAALLRGSIQGMAPEQGMAPDTWGAFKTRELGGGRSPTSMLPGEAARMADVQALQGAPPLVPLGAPRAAASPAAAVPYRGGTESIYGEMRNPEGAEVIPPYMQARRHPNRPLSAEESYLLDYETPYTYREAVGF